VAALAQGLKVIRVMKKRLISLMRGDVVNNSCRNHLIASEVELTEWLLLKLVIAEPVPALGVIEVVPG